MCLFVYRATLLIYPSLYFHLVNTNLGTQTKWHFCCEAFKAPPVIFCASCNNSNCNASNADRQNRLMDTRGEGEAGMDGEQHGNTHHHMRKRKPGELAVWPSGATPGLCDNLEGWMGWEVDSRGEGHMCAYH